MAFRRDGSNVTITLPGDLDRSGVGFFGDRSVTLRQERLSIYVLDRLKVKTTSVIPGSPKALPLIDANCKDNASQAVFIGKQSYNGYDTYAYRGTKTTAEGEQITDTRWRAPVLNCMELHGELELKTASGEVTVYRNSVTEVHLGEPDPALFAVPTDYREVLPSEMEKERMAVLGFRNPPDTLMRQLKRKDDEYLKQQR